MYWQYEGKDNKFQGVECVDLQKINSNYSGQFSEKPYLAHLR
jgi:hypothetical protein